MRRLLILSAVLAACMTLPSWGAQAFPSYPANCSIHTVFYGIGNGWYQGHAYNTCALPTATTLEGCVQDYEFNAWHNYYCSTASGYTAAASVKINFDPYKYSYRGWRMWGWTQVSCAGGECTGSAASGY